VAVVALVSVAPTTVVVVVLVVTSMAQAFICQ
jgi:hypothetical protein